jgi:hypothetical protein
MKKYNLIPKCNTCNVFVHDLKFDQIIGLIRYCQNKNSGHAFYRIASYSPSYDYSKLEFTTAVKAANFLYKRIVE